MSTLFVTVIIRVIEKGYDSNVVLESVLSQSGVKQVILVRCNGGAQDSPITIKNHEGATSDGSVLFVSVSFDVQDRAFLIAGQLAEYEPCILWDNTQPMPENFVDDLKKFYEPDHLVGIIGRRLEGIASFSSSPLIHSVDEATLADYLEARGMMLHRKFLQLPDTHYSERYSQNIGIWIIANARLNLEARCSVVPIRSPAFKGCSEQTGGQLSSQDMNEKEIDFALAYLNHSRPFRDWPEINASILPGIKPGAHFQRLAALKYKHLLVFGCQRSGTTWLSRYVGENFQEVFALTEEQSFHFLLDDYILPAIRTEYLVFQTTFINTEVESYENCPHNTKFLLIVRNPLAVCWSFLNNFQLLPTVYQYRKDSMQRADFVPHLKGELGMALEIYRQSMRTAMEIMSRCADRMQVLVYEDAVLDPEKVTENLSAFLQLESARSKAISGAKHDSLAKWRQFSEEQIEAIRYYADPLFNQVLESANLLGIRNAI
ncbi:MAG: sulfotransferase domain-containing protein [Acidobacteria bacterium]|nr:sulfotransferase domain-containing protein [Acidobacteriota bacterium]